MPSPSGAVSVLCVGFEPGVAEELERADDRFSVRADSAVSSLDGVDCLVVDPADADWRASLRRAATRRPPVPVVVVVDGEGPAATEVLDAGAADCVQRSALTAGVAVLATRVSNCVDAVQGDRWRAAVAATQDGVAVLDDDGRFVHVGEAYADLYGYDPGDLTGEHWERIYPDEEVSFVREEVFPTVEREGYWHGRTTGLRADGSTFTEDHVLSTTEDGALVCAVRDVTDREERERERERYRHMVDAMSEAACIYDAEGRFEVVNEYLAAFYGSTRSELEGTRSTLIERIRTEADGDPYRELVEGEREELRGEYEGTFPDHGHAVVDYRLARLTIDGEFDGVVAVARDVTDRKRRERELQRYETIVETLGDVVYTLDGEGRITFVNEVISDLAGYDPDALLGEHISAVMDEADVERGDRHVESLLDGEQERVIFEMDVVTADGERVPCENHVALLPFETEFRGTVGILRDITERKAYQRRLRRYERAVEGMDDPVAAVDADGRFLFANEPYREVHGVEGEVAGERVADVLDSDAYAAAGPHIDRAMAGGNAHHQTRWERPNGSDRTFDVRYYPLATDDGEIEGIVQTMRDITDRVDRERQLDVLDRVLRHNLHNEMNVMVGYAETIRDAVSGEPREWADQIVDSGEQLLELTDKERRIVDLITEPRTTQEVDVATLVHDAVESVVRTADTTVALDVPKALEIRTLPEMERAVAELVENAVEHGRETDRSATVSVSAHASDDGVVIRIADDGPGIPPLERRILTGETEVDTLHHGSGMGLWLVNWIVTLADGTLDFEDNDPQGSVVTIRLPPDLPEDRVAFASRE